MRFTKVHKISTRSHNFNGDPFNTRWKVSSLIFSLKAWPQTIIWLSIFNVSWSENSFSTQPCFVLLLVINFVVVFSSLAIRKGCLGLEPRECNFISSIFLQFSDESHISSLDLIDQKLRAKKIRHDYPIPQYCNTSNQSTLFMIFLVDLLISPYWGRLDDQETSFFFKDVAGFLCSQRNAVCFQWLRRVTLHGCCFLSTWNQ